MSGQPTVRDLLDKFRAERTTGDELLLIDFNDLQPHEREELLFLGLLRVARWQEAILRKLELWP